MDHSKTSDRLGIWRFPAWACERRELMASLEDPGIGIPHTDVVDKADEW